jgi:hypothetical protein
VCCSHSVADGGSNGVVGGDGSLVDTRGLMPIKWLEHPVPGMPLAARVGTSNKRLQAKRVALFL